jgi:hypothetical protein
LVSHDLIPFLLWPSLTPCYLGGHFWPFTHLVRKICREVTRKVWEES